MNILIIEDEHLTAEDLGDILMNVIPDVKLVKILNSVEESLEFFKEKHEIDLIFSDIQLGDGLSFDIFNKITPLAPIIFCTAYDEYALNAFETYGIHYILKPFNSKKIEEAIEKYKQLKSNFKPLNNEFNEVMALLQKSNNLPTNILVNKKGSVLPIKIKNIAVIYLEESNTRLLTFNGEKYYYDKNLSELEGILDDTFFRANRQFILNREAVKEVEELINRKAIIYLNIPFEHKIIISKEKKNNFYDWLEK